MTLLQLPLKVPPPLLLHRDWGCGVQRGGEVKRPELVLGSMPHTTQPPSHQVVTKMLWPGTGWRFRRQSTLSLSSSPTTPGSPSMLFLGTPPTINQGFSKELKSHFHIQANDKYALFGCWPLLLMILTWGGHHSHLDGPNWTKIFQILFVQYFGTPLIFWHF